MMKSMNENPQTFGAYASAAGMRSTPVTTGIAEKRFSDAESLSNALEVVVARNRHLELLLQQKDAEAQQRESYILMLQTTSKSREQEYLSYIASLRSQLISAQCIPSEDYLPSSMASSSGNSAAAAVGGASASLKKFDRSPQPQVNAQQSHQNQKEQLNTQESKNGKKKRLDRHLSEVTLNGVETQKILSNSSSNNTNPSGKAGHQQISSDLVKSLTPNKSSRHTRTTTTATNNSKENNNVSSNPSHELEQITYRKRMEDLLSNQLPSQVGLGPASQAKEKQVQSSDQAKTTTVVLQHAQKIGQSIFEVGKSAVIPQVNSPSSTIVSAMCSTSSAMITLRTQSQPYIGANNGVEEANKGDSNHVPVAKISKESIPFQLEKQAQLKDQSRSVLQQRAEYANMQVNLSNNNNNTSLNSCNSSSSNNNVHDWKVNQPGTNNQNTGASSKPGSNSLFLKKNNSTIIVAAASTGVDENMNSNNGSSIPYLSAGAAAAGKSQREVPKSTISQMMLRDDAFLLHGNRNITQIRAASGPLNPFLSPVQSTGNLQQQQLSTSKQQASKSFLGSNKDDDSAPFFGAISELTSSPNITAGTKYQQYSTQSQQSQQSNMNSNQHSQQHQQNHSTSVMRSLSFDKQASSASPSVVLDSNLKTSAFSVRPPVHSHSHSRVAGHLDGSSHSSTSQPRQNHVVATGNQTSVTASSSIVPPQVSVVQLSQQQQPISSLNRPKDSFFSSQTNLLSRKNSAVTLKQSQQQHQHNSNNNHHYHHHQHYRQVSCTSASVMSSAATQQSESSIQVKSKSGNERVLTRTPTAASTMLPATVTPRQPLTMTATVVEQQLQQQNQFIPEGSQSSAKQLDQEAHQASENALFKNSNYNFSSIIKTITSAAPPSSNNGSNSSMIGSTSTSSSANSQSNNTGLISSHATASTTPSVVMNLQTATRGKSISSYSPGGIQAGGVVQLCYSNSSIQDQLHRGSFKESNKTMQVSQKLPEGDHENEYTLHDSVISDSSSATLCVNNEHSIANPTFADEENAEFEGFFKSNNNNNNFASNGKGSGKGSYVNSSAQFRDSHQLLTKYSNINLKIKDFSNKKSVLFSKSPMSLVDSATKEYIPTKLFEEFFITGPASVDISKSSENIQMISTTTTTSAGTAVNSSGPSISVQPKVLYHYSAVDNSRSQKQIITEFMFPFGCTAKQLRMTNSYSSINEILYANNNNNSSGNANCSSSSMDSFVLAFNEANSLNIGATSTSSSFPKFHAKALALLDRINPQRLMYCLCYRIKDFVESTKSASTKVGGASGATTGENGSNSLQKSYSTSNMAKTKMKFWQSEKVFCFVTYFPFVEFFSKVVSHVLNLVKLKRIKAYNDRLDSIPNTLSNIDSDFFISTFSTFAEKAFADMCNQDLPEIGSVLEVNIQGERILQQVPLNIDGSRLSNEGGVYEAVAQFDATNLVFLFLCMLLEQSVAFTTKNVSLLTSTMLLFQNSLLKPLKWMNPMVFNLPEKLIPILDSPVPIMVGINKDISHIQKARLDVEFASCIFVQLGRGEVKLINAEIVEMIPLDLFNELKQLVEPALSRLQANAVLNSQSETNLRDEAFGVIEILSNYLVATVLSKIPKIPIYSKVQPGQLDYEAIAAATITGASPKHQSFISTLFRSQMISCYLEEKYKSQATGFGQVMN